MITPAAEKIQPYLTSLLHEKASIQDQIQKIKKQMISLKSTIHRNEILFLTAPVEAAGLFRLANDVRKDKLTLRDMTRGLKKLNLDLSDKTKRVTTAEFWLKQASYGDGLKQQEALRHIFN